MPLLARDESRTASEAAASSDRFLPPLDETHGPYRLRFARDERDRERIYRLRFEVFALELGEALPDAYTTGRDRDPFDAQCHHLLVEDASSGAAVGTYRMQVAETARAGIGFYSATEFDLAGMPEAVLAESVELGRACVAAKHRNKSVLFLLWRGLGAYLLWNRRRWFFGCSSLTSQDVAEGARLHARLEADGATSRAMRVLPKPGFECGPARPGPQVKAPKLFAIYLRHGAVVLGPPAIDRDFGTIDFLTLLDTKEMDLRLFQLFTSGLPERSA